MRQLKVTTQITNRDSDALEKYLQEIGKKKRITPEEEARITELRNMCEPGTPGYKHAIDSLVHANLRFVVSVAKQYLNQGLSLSDVINEGNIGLIKAAQRFDHTKGFKFISYAVWRIRQSILQALAEQSRIVRNPSNKLGTYRKITKVISDFSQVFDREPSVEEIADALDMDVTEVSEIINSHIRHTSLDAELGGEGDGATTMLDYLAAESEEIKGIFTSRNPGEQSETVSYFMRHARLTSIEKDIIYGIYGFSGLSIDDLSKKYDLTKERIRQIKERAIKKLSNQAGETTLLRDNIVIPEKKVVQQESWLQEKKPLNVIFTDSNTTISIESIISTTKDETTNALSKNEKKGQSKQKNKKTNIPNIKPVQTPENGGTHIENVEPSSPNSTTENAESTIHTIPNFQEIIIDLEKTLAHVIALQEKLFLSLKERDSTENILFREELVPTLAEIVLKLENYRATATKYRNILHNKQILNFIRKVSNRIYDIRQRLKINKKKSNITSISSNTIISDTSNSVPTQTTHDMTYNNITIGIDKNHIMRMEQSEVKVKTLLKQKINLEKQLETYTDKLHIRQCVKTFLHHFRETQKSALGKSLPYSDVLQGAKLRSGYVINQKDFNEHIFDFLDSINLQDFEQSNNVE